MPWGSRSATTTRSSRSGRRAPSQARTAVSNIGILAGAVTAQSDYSKLDTDAVVAAVTVPFLVAGAGVGLAGTALDAFGATAVTDALMASQMVIRTMQVGQKVMTAGEIFDAYLVARDASEWVESKQDTEFGLGISGVAYAIFVSAWVSTIPFLVTRETILSATTAPLNEDTFRCFIELSIIMKELAK